MNLVLRPRRIIETVDRRVIAAFELVDAVTGLPISTPAAVEGRGADVGGAPIGPALDEQTLRIRPNRRGVWVILRAPFFDTYTSTFENPPSPPETQPVPVRVRFAVTDAGPQYLPQEFDINLPRSLDPAAADSVFTPLRVGVFRAPSAPLLEGWAVLRVLVTQAGVSPTNRLPGVLLRVFRAPRAPADAPIGVGMTDWRGAVRGEALVPIAGIQRFRPGAGPNVIETEQAIELEATRDSAFTGATGQLPNVPRLLSGAGPGVIRPPAVPAGSTLTVVRPTTGLRVRAGREDVIELAMS